MSLIGLCVVCVGLTSSVQGTEIILSDDRLRLSPYPYNLLNELEPELENRDWEHLAYIREVFDRIGVKVAVEVGSYRGRSAVHIAKLLPGDGKLFAIDTWEGSMDQYLLPGVAATLARVYEQFLSTVVHEGVEQKVVPVRDSSSRAVEYIDRIPGYAQPDFVYIDASHDFYAVMEDVVEWYYQLSPKGVMCGDDYAFPQVEQAVHEFADSIGIAVTRMYHALWCLADTEESVMKRVAEQERRRQRRETGVHSTMIGWTDNSPFNDPSTVRDLNDPIKGRDLNDPNMVRDFNDRRLRDLPLLYSTDLSDGLLQWTGDGFWPNEAVVTWMLAAWSPRHVVEIGSYKGKSSLRIAKQLPKGGSLVVVDEWRRHVSSANVPQYGSFASADSFFQRFLSNVVHENLQDVIRPIRSTPAQALKNYESLLGERLPADLIFVDLHLNMPLYAETVRDWFPLLAPGGRMCGNDFVWIQIAHELKAFAKSHRLNLVLYSRFVWCFEPSTVVLDDEI